MPDDLPQNPHLLKHLEFIQLTIVRMGANSFIVKGWAVTFVAAILAFTNKDGNSTAALIALLPAVLFWRLDSFFLHQERLFRALYDEVRQDPMRAPDKIDFSLTTKPKAVKSLWDRLFLDDRWFRCAISKTIWPFYFILIVVIGVVYYVGPARTSEVKKWPEGPSIVSTTITTASGLPKSETPASSKATVQSQTTIGKASQKAGTPKSKSGSRTN